MTLHNKKYHQMNGLGNKIIVIDVCDDETAIDPQEVVKIHHTEGLSFDQLMVLRASRTTGTLRYVQIFNCDGSEARACGNGTRCVAWYLSEKTGSEQFTVETIAGILACERVSTWQYRVDMGTPKLAWNDIPLAYEVADTAHVYFESTDARITALPKAVCVNMGNPHAVFFVSDVRTIPLEEIGPQLEHHPLLPDRANISFVEVRSRTHLVQRVWERGTGVTLACGSGACAALVAAVRRDIADRTATVTLPGGDLAITWRDNNHVMLEGPVELEREGIFNFL